MDDVKGVISKRIKQRLEQLNLKQKDLVEQTGQPKSTINKIVNGTVTPRVDLLIPISKVLDVSIDWLVANEREKRHHYESELEEEIINILRHASKKEKIYIYFIISYIFKMLEEKSNVKKK
ncbi:helix-turn-helix domain-containing protein [Anoxybacillus flavithermus]|nr:helix-turn-helix transcriptional regulator [Anoxybacillus flavithermus]